MSFFVAPSDSALDLVTERMAQYPEFAPRYDAINELRVADQQGLAISVDQASRANGFFRVASLQGTLESLAKLLDPEFMKDKRRFYAWLDKHKQHCTYDRRRDALSKRLTHVDGKVVI